LGALAKNPGRNCALPKDHPNSPIRAGARRSARRAGGFPTLTGSATIFSIPLMVGRSAVRRNVEFEATFPELSEDEMLETACPSVSAVATRSASDSAKLFTRLQPVAKCNDGRARSSNSPEASCAYRMAAHVNVLPLFGFSS